MSNDKSCWNCKYQDLHNDTFLGLCLWFKIHKREEPKEIPSDMVDVGCKFFEIKENKQRKEVINDDKTAIN